MVIRFSTVDQDMDEVAAVTDVVVGDGAGDDVKAVP